VLECAGGEMATMGAPFLRKEDRDGDDARGDLEGALDRLMLALGSRSESEWWASSS
jgi:hypothetical protein